MSRLDRSTKGHNVFDEPFVSFLALIVQFSTCQLFPFQNPNLDSSGRRGATKGAVELDRTISNPYDLAG